MTITPEQVVQWAREAGFSEWRIGADENRSGLQMHELRRMQRLVNLAHEAGRKAGLEEAATVCCDIEAKKWAMIKNGGRMHGISAADCAVSIRERIK